ncbi:ester cyclase [Actinoallomurus rhizosphaericola]|uniref:ester cyclase n=1 Tax=Actinoallomurus rhizosphaericola TaxID=2952536 RepID=UPI00209379E0|nr:ester cyclase [Actinoallomurus rhizosphaericola]MCO5996014.1 ester cyclase [Actinoallomurus rhizosphaericola]
MTSKAEIVHRFYEDMLNQQRPELAEELITPDMTTHDPDAPRGPAAVRRVDEFMRAGFSDLHYQIEDVISEGNKAAVRWTMTGTHDGDFFGNPPTGRKIEISGNVIFGFEGDRVGEIWAVVDVNRLQRQIGAAPSS